MLASLVSWSRGMARARDYRESDHAPVLGTVSFPNPTRWAWQIQTQKKTVMQPLVKAVTTAGVVGWFTAIS